MSLFSVIKYPVSSPPTSEQLEALPPEIFDKWVGTVIIDYMPGGITPRNLGYVLSLKYSLTTRSWTPEVFERLRQLIRNMDE